MATICIPAPASAQAQSWPKRSVRFILPLGPGSGVDIGARLIADKLSQKWGKPVVVENKPGGDAIVAISAFTGANDDHTLLMAPTSTFTAHPFLHEKLPYEVKELVPIARVSNTVVAVGVPASLGINSVNELLARAKAEPGKLNIGVGDRRERFRRGGLPQEVRRRDRARALSRHRAGDQRSRRRAHPALCRGLRDHAAAGAGRKGEGDRDDQQRARPDDPRCADRERSRASGARRSTG